MDERSFAYKSSTNTPPKLLSKMSSGVSSCEAGWRRFTREGRSIDVRGQGYLEFGKAFI